MKKIIILLFLFTLFLSAEQGFSQHTGAKYGWLTVGYGYSQSVNGSWSSTGPVKFTVGGLLWNYVGLELSADTSWLNWSGSNLSWTLDLKPYLLIQSTLGNNHNALIPYIGIAPVLSVSGVDYDNRNYEDKTGFNVGVAAKGGLRIKIIDFLMLGIGIEYVYHKNDLPVSKDMSQFNAIAEVGFSW